MNTDMFVDTLRRFVEKKQIDFNVDEFRAFINDSNTEPQTVTVSLKPWQMPTLQETWTITSTITSPSMGTFEEIVAWRDYEHLGDRSFFQERETGWRRIRLSKNRNNKLCGTVYTCLNCISKRDLLYLHDKEEIWDGLLWQTDISFTTEN